MERPLQEEITLQPRRSRRRAFLGALGGTATFVAATTVQGIPLIHANPFDMLDPISYTTIPTNPDKPSLSLRETLKSGLLEGLVLWPGGKMAAALTRRLGIPTGNAQQDEERTEQALKEHPLTTYFMFSIFHPFIEEWISRLAPSIAYCKNDRGVRWD